MNLETTQNYAGLDEVAAFRIYGQKPKFPTQNKEEIIVLSSFFGIPVRYAQYFTEAESDHPALLVKVSIEELFGENY